MKVGRALAISGLQAKELENHDQTINAVKFNKKGTSTRLKGKQRHHQNRQESRTRYESRNRTNSRKDDDKCRNLWWTIPSQRLMTCEEQEMQLVW